MKGRSLTQTCCYKYQSICGGWKCLSGCSITLALNLAPSLLHTLATGMIHWGLTSARRALRCEEAHPVCSMLIFLLRIISQSTFSAFITSFVTVLCPQAIYHQYNSLQFLSCWTFLCTAVQCVGSLFPTKFLLSAEGNKLT